MAEAMDTTDYQDVPAEPTTDTSAPVAAEPRDTAPVDTGSYEPATPAPAAEPKDVAPADTGLYEPPPELRDTYDLFNKMRAGGVALQEEAPTYTGDYTPPPEFKDSFQLMQKMLQPEQVALPVNVPPDATVAPLVSANRRGGDQSGDVVNQAYLDWAAANNHPELLPDQQPNDHAPSGRELGNDALTWLYRKNTQTGEMEPVLGHPLGEVNASSDAAGRAAANRFWSGVGEATSRGGNAARAKQLETGTSTTPEEQQKYLELQRQQGLSPEQAAARVFEEREQQASAQTKADPGAIHTSDIPVLGGLTVPLNAINPAATPETREANRAQVAGAAHTLLTDPTSYIPGGGIVGHGGLLAAGTQIGKQGALSLTKNEAKNVALKVLEDAGVNQGKNLSKDAALTAVGDVIKRSRAGEVLNDVEKQIVQSVEDNPKIADAIIGHSTVPAAAAPAKFNSELAHLTDEELVNLAEKTTVPADHAAAQAELFARRQAAKTAEAKVLEAENLAKRTPTSEHPTTGEPKAPATEGNALPEHGLDAPVYRDINLPNFVKEIKTSTGEQLHSLQGATEAIIKNNPLADQLPAHVSDTIKLGNIQRAAQLLGQEVPITLKAANEMAPELRDIVTAAKTGTSTSRKVVTGLLDDTALIRTREFAKKDLQIEGLTKEDVISRAKAKFGVPDEVATRAVNEAEISNGRVKARLEGRTAGENTPEAKAAAAKLAEQEAAYKAEDATRTAGQKRADEIAASRMKTGLEGGNQSAETVLAHLQTEEGFSQEVAQGAVDRVKARMQLVADREAGKAAALSTPEAQAAQAAIDVQNAAADAAKQSASKVVDDAKKFVSAGIKAGRTDSEILARAATRTGEDAISEDAVREALTKARTKEEQAKRLVSDFLEVPYDTNIPTPKVSLTPEDIEKLQAVREEIRAERAATKAKNPSSRAKVEPKEPVLTREASAHLDDLFGTGAHNSEKVRTLVKDGLITPKEVGLMRKGKITLKEVQAIADFRVASRLESEGFEKIVNAMTGPIRGKSPSLSDGAIENFLRGHGDELKNVAEDGGTKSRETVFKNLTTEQKLDKLRGYVASEDRRSFAMEIWNVPRNALATGDESAILGQGRKLFLSDIRGGSKAAIDAFKTLKNPGATEKLVERIKADANFKRIIEDANIIKSDALFPTGRKIGHEELTDATLLSRIPKLNKGLEAFDRAYSHFLVAMRYDFVSNNIKAAEKAGIVVTNEDVAQLSHSANFLSGAGKYPTHVETVFKALGPLAFAPKYAISPLAEIGHIGVSLAKGSTIAARAEAKVLRNYYAAVAASVVGLKLAGFDVGIDPRSTDFGTLGVADHRINIIGPLQGMLVLAARQITMESVGASSEGVPGKLTKIDAKGPFSKGRGDYIMSYLGGKAHPSVSLVKEQITGKDFFGNELPRWESAVRHTTPLSAQAFYDAFSDEMRRGNGVGGAARALFIGGTSSLGVQDRTSTQALERQEKLEEFYKENPDKRPGAEPATPTTSSTSSSGGSNYNWGGSTTTTPGSPAAAPTTPSTPADPAAPKGNYNWGP